MPSYRLDQHRQHRCLVMLTKFPSIETPKKAKLGATGAFFSTGLASPVTAFTMLLTAPVTALIGLEFIAACIVPFEGRPAALACFSFLLLSSSFSNPIARRSRSKDINLDLWQRKGDLTAFRVWALTSFDRCQKICSAVMSLGEKAGRMML